MVRPAAGSSPIGSGNAGQVQQSQGMETRRSAPLRNREKGSVSRDIGHAAEKGLDLFESSVHAIADDPWGTVKRTGKAVADVLTDADKKELRLAELNGKAKKGALSPEEAEEQKLLQAEVSLDILNGSQIPLVGGIVAGTRKAGFKIFKGMFGKGASRKMLKEPPANPRSVKTIGREGDMKLKLENDLASRQHATLVEGRDGKLWLQDKSKNGTWLNGEKMEAQQYHQLQEGDVVRMGDEEWFVRKNSEGQLSMFRKKEATNDAAPPPKAKPTKPDPYEVLGLKPGASTAEIKDSWKRLRSKYHPDKVAQEPEAVQIKMKEEFQKLQQAYEELKAQAS